MKTFLIYATILALVLAGCASNPDNIGAAYVSPTKYSDFDCDQLSVEQQHIERRTNELYQSLKKRRASDNAMMGVGLVLFFPTLFALSGGDGPEATEYAQMQGEYEALRTVSVQKKCGIQFHDDLEDSVDKDVEPAVSREDKTPNSPVQVYRY